MVLTPSVRPLNRFVPSARQSACSVCLGGHRKLDMAVKWSPVSGRKSCSNQVSCASLHFVLKRDEFEEISEDIWGCHFTTDTELHFRKQRDSHDNFISSKMMFYPFIVKTGVYLSEFPFLVYTYLMIKDRSFLLGERFHFLRSVALASHYFSLSLSYFCFPVP